MPQEIKNISDEHFPVVAFTDETAIRCITEAGLLRDVMESQGWALARGAWESLSEYLHNEQLTAGPDRFQDVQRELLAIGLPDRIVRDAMQDAARADVWRRKEDRPQRQVRPFQTDDEASVALSNARTVQEMVAKPGWKLMMRRLVSAAYGARLLLDWCDPSMAKQIQTMIRAYYRPVKQLQEILDRGVDAEVHFIERQKEQEEETVNG